MTAYTPVTPREHAPDCRRGTLPSRQGALDFKGCARCAELWRRIGGDPSTDRGSYPDPVDPIVDFYATAWQAIPEGGRS